MDLRSKQKKGDRILSLFHDLPHLVDAVEDLDLLHLLLTRWPLVFWGRWKPKMEPLEEALHLPTEPRNLPNPLTCITV